MKKIALLVVPALLLSCDQGTPVGPELTTELNPNFCWDNPFPEGRMTGGGTVRLLADDGDLVRVTHGFTLHCDILLSNNLEVNWGGANQWHIEKESLGDVRCTDAPGVNPEPPPAPFDTFEAWAVGRLNGEWGSKIHFILQDAGEPGGKNDKAMMLIWAPGADTRFDAPVLNVPFDFTVNGNLQAHYDQPHGSNVNR